MESVLWGKGQERDDEDARKGDGHSRVEQVEQVRKGVGEQRRAVRGDREETLSEDLQ